MLGIIDSNPLGFDGLGLEALQFQTPARQSVRELLSRRPETMGKFRILGIGVDLESIAVEDHTNAESS